MNKKVAQNYWEDSPNLIGASVVEYYGHSYDKRKLGLYRLDNGWLGWLPDYAFDTEDKER